MANRRATVLSALLLCLTAGLILSCRSRPTGTWTPQNREPTTASGHGVQTDEDPLAARRGPRLDAVRAEPQLRIRVGKDLSSATLGNRGWITITPGDASRHNSAPPRRFQAPLRISHNRLGFVLTEPSGKRVQWRLASLRISGPGQRIQIDGDPYPGQLELVSITGQSGQPTGRFDAVNHVGMEAYLPGVLSKELYPGWHPNAYRAQAIAARSYAIWEMNLPNRRTRHWDLESTEASMAYIGQGSDKARDAVAATRGQVLTYDQRVLPAFFSSCSGGVGQDAIAAWPNKVDDLPPLRGRVHGGWGSISTKYRWGPVSTGTDALAKAFARWGRLNKHPIAGLQGLRSVQPSATNAVGRPTRFTVTDARGQRFELPAESLRNATNTALPGNAHAAQAKVFSSNARYTIAGNTTTITGQGFGHGVGMCQFGAQHMASNNRHSTQILGFYYPGTRVRKAY